MIWWQISLIALLFLLAIVVGLSVRAPRCCTLPSPYASHGK